MSARCCAKYHQTVLLRKYLLLVLALVLVQVLSNVQRFNSDTISSSVRSMLALLTIMTSRPCLLPLYTLQGLLVALEQLNRFTSSMYSSLNFLLFLPSVLSVP
jgi:hypothetical protein